jgi:hypothetical protein
MLLKLLLKAGLDRSLPSIEEIEAIEAIEAEFSSGLEEVES